MDKIEFELEEFWEMLRKYKGVLSIRKGTKIIKGKNTGKKCITFYVSKKLDDNKLSKEESIPKKVKGMPTDVVELSTPDYILGETSVSKLSPEQQRRISGGVIRKCQ